MATTKYDVFISYSRKDYVDAQGHVIKGNTVSKIKDALTEAGITYWFDEDGIYSGDNFTEKIAFNIMNADIFVFISSASSNSSEWTSKEIATAHEFKRRIIPIRIDDSPYNIKVMFRIADIDYIDYYNNPDKGIDDLIRSILAYKNGLIQEKIIKEIESKCKDINNEVSIIDIARKNLLQRLSEVIDKGKQAQLKTLIETTNPAHKAEKKNAIIIEQLNKAQEQQALLQKQLSEAQKPNQEVDNLKSQLNEKTQTIAQLQSDLTTTKGKLETTQGELDTTQKQLNQTLELLNSRPYPYFENPTSYDGFHQEQQTLSGPSIVPNKPQKKLVELYKSHKKLFRFYGWTIGLLLITFLLFIARYYVNGTYDTSETEKGLIIFSFILLLIITPIFIIHFFILLSRFNRNRND